MLTDQAVAEKIVFHLCSGSNTGLVSLTFSLMNNTTAAAAVPEASLPPSTQSNKT